MYIKKFLKHYYVMLVPAFLWLIFFSIVPMFGIIMAFEDYNPGLGMLKSPFIGLENFRYMLQISDVRQAIVNTVIIAVAKIIGNIIVPLTFAILLNELCLKKIKRPIQTIVYMPHFLSVIVTCSLVIQFLSPTTGIINKAIAALGGTPRFFMTEEKYFKPVYVLSEVWSTMGWNAIIYLSALSGVDMALYEAAEIDGASRLQRIWYINLPSIMPTIIITLILRAGSVMNVGYEKILLLQNELNYNASEVISTYVYNKGILQAQYSFSTAVGLFNNVINFAILMLVNGLAKAANNETLW